MAGKMMGFMKEIFLLHLAKTVCKMINNVSKQFLRGIATQILGDKGVYIFWYEQELKELSENILSRNKITNCESEECGVDVTEKVLKLCKVDFLHWILSKAVVRHFKKIVSCNFILLGIKASILLGASCR